MSTPQSTPVRQAVKLGLVGSSSLTSSSSSSGKSLPLTNEYKRLLADQHHRLSLKHQQDLDLLDDIRSYVKARLSIEKDYTNGLQKLAKQHTNHISKKFTLLAQLGDHCAAIQLAASTNEQQQQQQEKTTTSSSESTRKEQQSGAEFSNANSLYKVWSEHIVRLANTSRQRSDQFEQLNLIIDKLKDIRSHKVSIGKRCLDTHLKRIHEELLVSMLDVERAKKLYYEDESQAKKARETEERYKKKRTGLLTKFTDLQAKKEKSSAQREATDIQSTQARNDYIMALAAANAHLKYYYQRDLNDFIHLIDDGALDQCKLFMATLSECDINSLKVSLSAAQSWSRLINLSGSQQTNYIFLDCEQSKCLRAKQELAFEPCNQDPVVGISLEHNADYALQHEIDKWFTWFKKECRNLSQLMHQLDTCQHALAEGKRSIELNGQTLEELEPKVLELKQQLRKCEAAKLKAQARLKVIKEGGMQIEEWADVESEIRQDMARAQEEQQRAAQRLKEAAAAAAVVVIKSNSLLDLNDENTSEQQQQQQQQQQHDRDGPIKAAVQLQISHDSDDSEMGGGGGAADSIHNLASVSRSTSNLAQKQQNAMSGYSALTDPSLVWQDDAWGQSPAVAPTLPPPQITNSNSFINEQPTTSVMSPTSPRPFENSSQVSGDMKQMAPAGSGAGGTAAMASIQSSSPLSAIVNGGQHLSQSPYQGILQEAYKSDYECDYTRTGAAGQQVIRSAASSADVPTSFTATRQQTQEQLAGEQQEQQVANDEGVEQLLHKRVVALYKFERSNEDDLAFNEGDLMYVLEVNIRDPDWIKAQLETSGEQGFIPSSYVRIVESVQEEQINYDDQQQQEVESWQEKQVEELFCKALYDYTPEANTFDEHDGLPHLALCQGELMRIIDQGQDDGWWLVEKQQPDGEEQIRGHVPSMLVNVVDGEPGDDQLDEDDEVDEEEYDDDGEVSDRDELEPPVSVPPPPSFQAPILAPPEAETETEVAQQPEVDKKSGIGNSLIATSFIIIEPTPEVETKRFEDNMGNKCADSNDDDNAQQQPAAVAEDYGEDLEEGKRRIEQQLPSSQVSYSVVNEEFVLEKPTRIPYQQQAGSMDSTTPSHQPTIEEEDDDDQGADSTLNRMPPAPAPPPPLQDMADEEEEQMFQAMPMVAPPEVVIDVVEAIPRSPDLSFDDGDDEQHNSSASNQGRDSGGSPSRNSGDIGDDESNDTNMDQRRPIKHSGFVDVSPILRHHAEEFCKQLIEEAIMLAPGSRIGPSTSSASVVNAAQDDAGAGNDVDDYDDDQYNDEQNGSFEEST